MKRLILLLIEYLLKAHLNLFSRLIAFVLEGIDPNDLTPEDQKNIKDWIDLCRKEDALDGVVEIRKASEDFPEEP